MVSSLKFNSVLYDSKIKGLNVTAQMNMRDYWRLAQNILDENDLQRRPIQSSKSTPYSLLRRDLLDGCIIPPIVLAVTQKYSGQIENYIRRAAASDSISQEDEQKIYDFVRNAFTSNELIILDGLQRTTTIGQSASDAEKTGNTSFFDRPVRLEVYIGLSKMGVFYRMLTLNTGQSPMSLRHQLEIMYHDYIDSQNLPDNIVVLREIDEKKARGISRYKYSDVIEMFYSYSTGNPRPVDKQTLVDHLKEMEFLEQFTVTDQKRDDMLNLLCAYNKLVVKVNMLAPDWQFTDSGTSISRPFATNVPGFFAKSQPMTGFGAEVRRMLKMKSIKGVPNLEDLISHLAFKQNEPDRAMNTALSIIDQIGKTAPKIGDAQRLYFQMCFRELFNQNSDSYLDLSTCWLSGQHMYNSFA